MPNDVNSILRPSSIEIPADIVADMEVEPMGVQVAPMLVDNTIAGLTAQYQKVARSQATLAANLLELDRMVYQYYKTGV